MTKGENLNIVKDIVAIPKKACGVIFLLPNRRTKFSYFLAAYFQCSRIFLIISSVSILYHDLSAFSDVVSTVSAFLQGTKVLIPIFYEKDLNTILIEAENHFTTTKKTENFYSIVYKFLAYFRYLVYADLLGLTCLPILNSVLPFAIIVPDFPHAFIAMYLMQVVQITYDMVAVFICDTLYASVSLLLIGQYRILNDRLRNLNVRSKDKREIRECIAKQLFLFKYTETFMKIFKIVLLIQYYVSTCSICVMMLAVGNRNVTGVLSVLPYLSGLFVELAIYCFLADEIAEESLKTSLAIYECPWYENHNLAKGYVANVIMRSQKPIVFTAAGIIKINKEAFTQIFKLTLSLYTIMQDMSKE